MGDGDAVAYTDGVATLYRGDCRTVLPTLPAESVHCVVTSPPYWGLRDYGVAGQLGLEAHPDEYVASMVAVFREVRRVLREDGTLWLNLGDSYNNRSRYRPSSHQPGLKDVIEETWRKDAERGRVRMSVLGDGIKEKDLVGIPWMVAFALRADGWYLRSDIVWSKPNPMPESVTDRPTKSHEYLFLLSRSARYFYDADAVREPSIADHGSGVKERADNRQPDGRSGFSTRIPWPPGAHGTRAVDGNGMRMPEKWINSLGRNRRTVWTIPTQPYPDAHFATFPEALVEPCVLAGCPVQGVVLDPFAGSGTTLAVAKRLDRRAIGIELSAGYAALVARRCRAKAAQITLIPDA